jgi:hypothetical protein
MLIILMINVFMLNDVMLNVFVLNVVAPSNEERNVTLTTAGRLDLDRKFMNSETLLTTATRNGDIEVKTLKVFLHWRSDK